MAASFFNVFCIRYEFFDEVYDEVSAECRVDKRRVSAKNSLSLWWVRLASILSFYKYNLYSFAAKNDLGFFRGSLARVFVGV